MIGVSTLKNRKEDMLINNSIFNGSAFITEDLQLFYLQLFCAILFAERKPPNDYGIQVNLKPGSSQIK